MSNFKRKVNIVESTTPPTNQYDWWYDLNSSSLKRPSRGGFEIVGGEGGGSSDTPEYDESGTIVKTTYEELRDLYYAGSMIPGVKYQFNYTFYPSPTMVYPVNSVFVHINKAGELIAQGMFSPTSDDTMYDAFTAKFAFDNTLVSPSKLEVIKDLVTVDWYYGGIATKVLAQLRDAGFTVYIEPSPNGPYFFFHNVVVYSDDEGDFPITYIRNQKGQELVLDDGPLTYTIRQVQNELKAALYDIQYEEKFHCKLIDGEIESDPSTVCRCYANVYHCPSDTYLDSSKIGNIPYGTIIDSKLENLYEEVVSSEYFIYISNRILHQDSSDA